MQSRMFTAADPRIFAAGWLSNSGAVPRDDRDRGRLRRRQRGNLAEDLVHHLGASSKSRHDLMPVYQLCRSGLVVTGEQRDCFDRHAMSGQQRYKRMSQLAGDPCAAQPRSLGDLTELPADIVIIEWRPDGGAEY
jgi:hypothetical protein